MSRLKFLSTGGLVLILFGSLTVGWTQGSPRQPAHVNTTGFGYLPFAFEPNVGQFASDTLYLARARSSFIYFAPSEITVELLSKDTSEDIGLRFKGARPNPSIQGIREVPGRMNYLVGSDPQKWKQDIPRFAALRYADLYHQIHADFRGTDQGLEFDFVVEPGGDPREIGLTFDRISALRIAPEGHLMLSLSDGRELAFLKPVTYQQNDGIREEVTSRYNLNVDGSIGIEVGAYDKSRQLVIDPIIAFSTFLGGSQSDAAYAIAVDAAGNSFVAGETRSPNFPSQNPVQGVRGSLDTFIAKLDPTGKNLIFATIIGGWRDDRVFDLKINPLNEIVICGETSSFDFPATPGTIQPSKGGGKDAFVAALSPDGKTLSFATFLGGFSDDAAHGIAVNDTSIAITGTTFSLDFPATPDTLPAVQGAPPDAFITKLNLSGRQWIFSGHLGGGGIDEGRDVAMDAQGAVYVVGRTLSTNLPVVAPFQKDSGGSSDGLVAKISPDGRTVEYVSYLGGASTDTANRLITDQQGNLIIVGTTSSGNFPLQLPLQPQLGGGSDAFITILGLKGAGAIFSTYLGGKGDDAGLGLALDSANNIYLTGETSSSDFPVVGAFQKQLAGGRDAFVAKIAVQGTAYLFSTYLGGSNDESGEDLAALGTRSVVVVGQTSSGNFPTVGANDASYNGSTDAFVTKISETNDLYFAQFGNGAGSSAGIKSTIRILNLDSQFPSNVRIRIDRQDGSPMALNLNGEPFSGEDEFVIPASGLLSLATDGEGDLQVGTVSVTSNTAISGVILFQSTAGVTGVGSAKRLRKFAAPVEVGAGTNTGIAVMNLGPPQRIRIVLMDGEGKPLAEARKDLESDSQFAQFITEMSWDNPPDFTSFLGSVVVTGNGDLAGMVLLQTPEGLTTQPVDQKQ